MCSHLEICWWNWSGCNLAEARRDVVFSSRTPCLLRNEVGFGVFPSLNWCFPNEVIEVAFAIQFPEMRTPAESIPHPGFQHSCQWLLHPWHQRVEQWPGAHAAELQRDGALR